MKLRKCWLYLALVVSTLSLLCTGCGSSSGAVATTITLSSSVGDTLILGQSTTITAAVTGPANTDVNWVGPNNTMSCQYTTTTVSSSGTSTTATAKPCPSDNSFGTLSNTQTTGTATFTAPGTLPNPTTFPGLVIEIFACTVATPVKCNNPALMLTIDSGISVTLTPSTAAVPTSENQPFFAVLTNDLQNKGVTWLLTQQIPTGTATQTNTNAYASLVTCTVSGNATGCGSINSNGVYTAPSAVPTTTVPANNTNSVSTDCTTPQNLTIVATSVEDPTRFAIGTITVTQGGAITFNGISPTIAPQGALYWDIFLNAPNMSSSTQITLTDANQGTTPLNSAGGQVKVLFPIPVSTTTTTTTSNGCTITTTTSPGSSGARIRLLANNLATAGPVTVSISDPAEPVTQSTTGTFTYNIIPVRPTVSSTTPNDIIQNTNAATQLNIPMTIDGGYFGNQGQLARATFAGAPLPGSTNGQGMPTSFSKQLDVQFPATSINSGLPGLYSLAVNSTASPAPSPSNPAVSNLAVFPSYATDPPTVTGYVSLPGGSNPSAVDIDPMLGVVAVAETSANAVQFYSIGSGTLTPISTAAVGNLPTGLSINRTNHTVAVVNYVDQSVTVLPIPGAPVQAPGTPFTFSIAGVLQGAVNPAPLPYSIGVDPDTNFGVVAYSSTSSSSLSNLGFLVDLNPGDTTVTCLPFSGAPSTPPCAFAQVTLNSGAYPQVAMATHGHIAYVSPGGSGALSGIDVTKPSSSIGIQSLTLAAGVVTVTTTLCNTSTANPSQILFPGNSGTVLITGVPLPGSSANSTTLNFNGAYTASAISDTSFTFLVTSTSSGTVNIPNVNLNCPSTPSTTPIPPAPSSANVFFSSPNLILSGISQTAQGISINPISNTAALADPNATGSSGAEINLINNLDQSVSDITYFANCTFYSATCSNGPELLGTADVAWQPYSNAVVSYNPNLNQVSVSDPTSARRYALACELTNPAGGAKTSGVSTCLVDPTSTPLPAVCQAMPINNSVTACVQLFQSQVTLQGTGTTSVKVNNGTTNSLTLWGGLAVDPPTNQAFVVMSGSNQIDIINLGPCSATGDPAASSTQPCVNPFNNLKPAEISDILVPTPAPAAGTTLPLGAVGGIPNATVPQGTLTSANNLAGVQIFGSGFDNATSVRLDGTPIPASDITFVSSRQLTVTIPASFLAFPHRFALDLINGSGSQSNPTDFFVIQAVDLSTLCPPAIAQPSSVAIADQLSNGPFQPIAVVSNTGCNNVIVVDTNPADAIGGTGPNPGRFGTVISSVAVGAGPEGVAVSQPFGLAVVANNTAGTASVVNLLSGALAVPDTSTGTNPTGVAIDDQTGAAIVTNTGSNTITELNLSTLFGSGAATSLTPVSIGGVQEPTAIAIDPDRGTNNQGIAVITSLQISQGSSVPNGELQVVDIGLATPALSTVLSPGSVTAPTTGIVFDPSVVTGTANNGVFYASSSGGNIITSFNPDDSSQSSVNVGINPTALALNPQTGTIMTTNVAGKTSSFVDVTSSPLKTVQTLGLPGSPQFGVAIDPFTNLAFIVDQANNRLFILPASK